MQGFLGEISCKIDPKGRLTMPARFVKQLPPENGINLVVNRGIEKCLVLYTMPEWSRVTQEMEHLNMYNSEERLFARLFFRGASELELDDSNRLLLPKRLMEYAEIDKDVVLVGYLNRIEIWAEQVYEQFVNIDAESFAVLADKVMNKPASTALKGDK